eukprot:GILK01006310.1.p1 GENE.GILK01006310.1~~GILK01006310.1.p1  ORF type:complete len:858 (-),score=143.59 GILK01006310.1:176-2749(-)
MGEKSKDVDSTSPRLLFALKCSILFYAFLAIRTIGTGIAIKMIVSLGSLTVFFVLLAVIDIFLSIVVVKRGLNVFSTRYSGWLKGWLAWTTFDSIIHIAVAWAFDTFNDFLFIEPDGTVNADLESVHSFFRSVVVLNSISAAVQLSVLLFSVGYAISRTVWFKETVKRLSNQQTIQNAPHLMLELADDANGAVEEAQKTPKNGSQARELNPKWTCSRVQRIAIISAMCISVLVIFVVLAAVGTGPQSNQNCDPLNAGGCVLPFPSSFYLKQDDSTATGYRVNIPDDAMPILRYDLPTRFYLPAAQWNTLDGFSTVAPIAFHFPNVASSSLVGYNDIASSVVTSSATTVIINVNVTNEVTAHFVEVDSQTTSDLLLMQPAVPLKYGTHYVVAVRNLKSASGSVLEPPTQAFKDLRDNVDNSEISADRRALFESVVFPTITALGWQRSELQLAWHFVTTSRSSTVGQMTSLRDNVLNTVATPSYRISSVNDSDCTSSTNYGRIVYGYVSVPRVGSVFGSNAIDVSAPITSTREAAFVVAIPCSVINSGVVKQVVQYGHGLFNDRSEVVEHYLGSMAHTNQWVVFALEWIGFSRFDLIPVINLLMGETGDFVNIPNRLAQSYMNQAVGLKMVQTSLKTDPLMQYQGNSVLDTTNIVFYGNSLGTLLGGGYFALSTELQRGAFGVAGGIFSFLAGRSNDFALFMTLLKFRFYDSEGPRVFFTLAQMLLDPTEVGGWFRELYDRPAVTGRKEAVIQVAFGDAQVSRISGAIFGRAFGAHTISPQTESIYGMTESASPYTGSGFTEWNFTGIATEPSTNVACSIDTNTHEKLRRVPEAQQQIAEFFETGTVKQFCTGVCTASV